MHSFYKQLVEYLYKEWEENIWGKNMEYENHSFVHF
jgi:hypothetical protein